jgi:serine/threonine-protein kinase
MTLIPGARLGVFEIIALVGAGGMGEVIARDTRLGRDVALKVLPIFREGCRSPVTFPAEAQLLACLNHPNIAAFMASRMPAAFGRWCSNWFTARPGRSLAARPDAGREVVTAARQIADALEAAHEQGVIHRDLKPANIKISPDGNIKVLDFGLAKALESAPAASQLTHSPTLSLAGTFAGVILGTAAYMSPEQAKGLPADQRSDIFSFGCVVFEMLTARQAFQADTVSEMMAAVLLREPDLDTLPNDVHPRLVDLVRRCLDKNPRRRWQAIGDVRFELDAIAADPGGLANRSDRTATPATMRLGLPNVAWLIATAAVVAAVAIAATRWTTRAADAPLVARFSIALPEDQSLLRLPAPTLAFSPDGTKLVYAANRQLFVRSCPT